ncbi:MAG: esterase [Bacteroides sp.]|nr:esterase [Bacteroides sp.]
MKQILFLLYILFSVNGRTQADFYSLQALGDRYVYNSEYFDNSREIQIYRSGVDATLVSDSLLTVYVFDVQYPPTFNLFCSTFEMIYPDVSCIIVGISNPDRQSELAPPYTDYNSVKGYDNPGKADSLLLSLKNELIPFIREKYHTSSRNILVGHSLGETFVTYAMLTNPNLFSCILAVSPNYIYSNKIMIDRLTKFSDTYDGDHSLYIYLANGQKDKIEETFKPATKEAVKILSNHSRIILIYDSLNIEKHSHIIFEGYYRGLMKVNDYVHMNNQ